MGTKKEKKMLWRHVFQEKNIGYPNFYYLCGLETTININHFKYENT